MIRTRPLVRHLLFIGLLGAAVGGCDAKRAQGADEGGEEEKGSAANVGDEGVAPPKPDVVLARAEPEFDPERDKQLRKGLCDLFTADIVAKHFDVEATELKKISVMGCTYSWNDDVTMLEVSVMMPRVHDSLDDAKSWYESATKTKSKEELDADFAKFEEQLAKSDKLDTKVKKDTADSLSDIAKSATPDEGVSYEDVPGIGSQARASSTDGALWIRSGNLTFQLRAYEGPVKPQLPIDMKNVQASAKAQVASDKKWVSQTVAERKAAAKKVAPDIVAALNEAAS